jgi:hypothetical protein
LRVAPRSLPRVARSPEEIASEEDAKARREEAALRAAADAAFAAAASSAEAAMNAAAREAEAADAEAAGSGSPPPAFPEWFGAVDDDELLVDDDDAADAGTAAVVDGFESGASNLLVPSDAARELEERDAWEERRRTEWERQDAEQREREAREKARAEAFKGLKGEAMWIDVGGWKRDADAGVPSGAWGRDALSKSGGVEPTLGHDAVTSRSLAAAAAERMARASEGAAAIDARRARSARAGGCVLYTGPHTTPHALCSPILKDFSRRISPPTPSCQSPPSTPFNSTPEEECRTVVGKRPTPPSSRRIARRNDCRTRRSSATRCRTCAWLARRCKKNATTRSRRWTRSPRKSPSSSSCSSGKTRSR